MTRLPARPPVRRLPSAVVDMLAAGEVIERPAAVVKELVENALDAGATAIAVDLVDGGAALVRVVDDGWGIPEAELELALARHATSKLSRFEDLTALATLGFRGEALPSILAISRFRLTSRARGEGAGVRVAGAAGVIAERLGVSAPEGTAIEVEDLFFSVPVRLKFLKSVATETAASLRILTQLALLRPDVAFRVTSNGRVALTAPAAATLRDRVGALWGYPFARRLLEVDRSVSGVRVTGLLGPAELQRANRDHVVTAVNGRAVRDSLLVQAVLDGYRPLLARDRYPSGVLALTVAGESIDVNAHPGKTWIRFRDPRLVQHVVSEALNLALSGSQAVVAPGQGASAPLAGEVRWDGDRDGAQAGLLAEPGGAPVRLALGRVLGQVQDTFVVTDTGAEVLFIDQHAGHERVVFDRLAAAVRDGHVASQLLLVPELVELPAAAVRLEGAREALEQLGFALEIASPDSVRLHAVPMVLAGDDPRRLLEAIVDEVRGGSARDTFVDRLLALVSCRSAIKANTPLGPVDMDRLVGELARCATPFYCPHGRPTLSRVAMADVRRDVRRTW